MSASIRTILADLEGAGVKIEVSGGNLRLDAPAGVLTPDLVTRIKAHKSVLLVVLNGPPILHAALAAFPEAVCEAVEGPPPPGGQPYGGHRAKGPIPPRAMELIRPVDRLDPDRARDLADLWMERVAMCEVDGGRSTEHAEQVAYGELMAAIETGTIP